MILLDSASTSQNIESQLPLAHDYELNGTVNRAANEGAKFALLLAMLEQSCIHRPHLEKPDDAHHALLNEPPPHYYRVSPLSAGKEYWQTCQHTSQLVHSNQLHGMKLWLAIHPEPLSQHNNPQEIDSEIIANCSISAQNRIQQGASKQIAVDETRLYDILQTRESARVSL